MLNSVFFKLVTPAYKSFKKDFYFYYCRGVEALMQNKGQNALTALLIAHKLILTETIFSFIPENALFKKKAELLYFESQQNSYFFSIINSFLEKAFEGLSP